MIAALGPSLADAVTSGKSTRRQADDGVRVRMNWTSGPRDSNPYGSSS